MNTPPTPVSKTYTLEYQLAAHTEIAQEIARAMKENPGAMISCAMIGASQNDAGDITISLAGLGAYIPGLETR